MARILIVDDRAEVSSLYEMALKENGHEILHSADSGMEAISFLERSPVLPEVVVIDQQMPLMDGLTTLRELRKTAPDCHAVFCTADSEIANAVNDLARCHLLLKPFPLQELIDHIGQIGSNSE